MFTAESRREDRCISPLLNFSTTFLAETLIKLTVYIRSMYWIIKYFNLSYFDISRENCNDEKKNQCGKKSKFGHYKQLGGRSLRESYMHDPVFK